MAESSTVRIKVWQKVCTECLTPSFDTKLTIISWLQTQPCWRGTDGNAMTRHNQTAEKVPPPCSSWKWKHRVRGVGINTSFFVFRCFDSLSRGFHQVWCGCLSFLCFWLKPQTQHFATQICFQNNSFVLEQLINACFNCLFKSILECKSISLKYNKHSQFWY